MPIQIDEPLTIATVQNYKFKKCSFGVGMDGVMRASVVFSCTNENGEHLSDKQISYEGADYNTWWNNFSTGTFLYQEFSSKENLGLTISPNSLDDDFLNH